VSGVRSMSENGATCRESGFSATQAELCLRRSTEPLAKDALRACTEEAVKLGAFGVPFMVLEGSGVDETHKVWFGAESLHKMAWVLGKPWMEAPQASSKL
jgi:2-hydroxychromene-2-carboxylate isomerase